MTRLTRFLLISSLSLVSNLASHVEPVAAQPPAIPTCVPPPAGLVSWWPGEGNAQDIWGSNNGTLQNGATFAQGRVGQAFSLDGVDDSIDVANSASLIPQQVTLEAWINASQAGIHATPVTKEPTEFSPQVGYGLRQRDDNTFWFVVGKEGVEAVAQSTTTVVVGRWYHLVGTYDGTQLRLYVNGALEASTPSTLIIDSDFPLRIGALNSDSRYFHGSVDEVSVYNRALTQTEIQAIFNAGGAGKCKPSIFVASIDPSYTTIGGLFNVTGSVTIHDKNGSPIPNATVALSVIEPNHSKLAFAPTTDANGVASASFVTSLIGAYTFAVANVRLRGRTYDSSLNVETRDTLTIP